MKKYYFSKSRLLLTLIALLIGASPTWAKQTLPYSYGFEDNNLDTDGWTALNPSNLNSSEFGIVNTAPRTGTYKFQFSSYNDKGDTEQYLISPELNAPTGVIVSFYHRASSSTEYINVGYSTSTADIESFTWTYENLSVSSSSYNKFEETFPAGTKYIALKYAQNWKYRVYIDDFSFKAPPTCITPTGLTTSDLTSSSVVLSWTSDAETWNVQYKKAADTDWTDVGGNLTSKSYTITGLQPATAYQARVRTYCDASDQSEWTDAVSFTTDCGTLTVDAVNSFSEDFSGSGIPTCWGTIDSGTYKWSISSNRASTSYYGPIYLILPPMELSVNSLLTFDNYFNYASDYNGNTNKSSIVLSTTGTAAEDFSTTLYTFTKDELPTSSSTSLPKEISLAAYTGQTVYIAFKHEATNGHSWAVDNVVVKEAPACIKPTGLAASNPTAEGVTLSWTTGGDEADWQISYSTTETFDPTTDGTIIDVTTNPYTLTGLDKESTYYVAIRSKKGDDTSDWTDKISFTTTATCFTPTAFAASNVTLNSATLTWTDETEQSAWEVSYSTTSGDPDNGTIVAVTEKTYTIENLTSGTTYYASVRAVNSDNDKSAWSTEISFVPGVLTVNDGTATNIYIPVYGNMVDERLNNSQFIIPAESLTSIANSQINKLVFYTSTINTDWGNATFNVYISETESTTFTNSALSSWNDMTKVYTGVLSVSKNKMEILLDDSYEYEGGNLMIGLNQTVKGSYTNTAWYGITTTNYAAIYNYNTTNTRQQFLPKTSIYYSPISTAPKMAVDKSEIAFGLVEQNSEQTATFKIENKGKADLENITIACTDGAFSIDKTSVEKILRKDDDNYEAAVVTVTFNAETIGEFSGMITVSAEDQENIEIAVSGIVKDPSKIFIDFADGKFPDEWTSVSTGTDTSSSYNWTAETGYARTSASSASYSYALTSPQVVFTEGEKVLFKTSRNTSYISNNSLAVEYSTNGTTWTTIETFSGDEYGLDSWTLREVTIPTADAKYIRFNGYNTKITDIYGGKLPDGAKFAINTDGTTTQDFGAVEQNADAEKTYTVTNNGNADLYLSIDAPEGFSIEGGNALLFTNNYGWNAVYMHAWNGEGALTTWPGVPGTYVGKNGNNEDQYAFVVPEGATGILFDNGNNGQQTQNITNFNVTGYYLNGDLYDGNKYWAESWGTAPSALKVAAGAPETFTVKMNTETIGDKSGNIVLKMNALNSTEFTIPVTGFVYDSSLPCVTFDDNQLPENWTNASWTFANGIATGKSSSAYLTTPKLKFSEGDFIVLKARRYDSDTSDYLTVQGSSDNGSTWTAYSKKLQNADGLTYPDFGTIVLSDIPTTVNKLRFVGFYAEIDEIMGLNYAPVLSVTTGEPAATVTSPANYDFGECAADATVTYTFANAGAGTINITNVAITGDGAASYSTNWTESVAAPFDLVITRSYDANRTSAQDAVVTVTTSEGDFVINVTGTDKAANAPELAVTLGSEAVTTGAAADFGTNLQAVPAAKTYTITNSGTGTLTGTIATSDATQFTVSKTEFSLGAAESTTFDLALVYNTTYGAKAATITIHPTNEGLADIVINATASTLDPEAWIEDFAAGTLPTGWTQGTWTIGTFTDYENKTTMALAPSGTSAGTLITPCLSAKAGDVLTWDGYFNWYDEAMTVEYSNDDQTTWSKIYDAYKAQDDFGSTRYTHKAMSFNAPADGNYYLRFTSTYSNGVDNFAGFKLALPDHIMAITASNIPTSSSYSPTMKATKSFNATVTVKESRGVAEENVVAKFYMDDQLIGTSEATSFAANESKVINITATPTVAATEGAQMHIEVEYAGGTLKTANEMRYVAEFVRLDMTETSEPTIETGYSAVYDVVTLTRSFVEGWNTFVAPQAVAKSEFGEGAKFFSFTDYADGNLKFSTVSGETLNPATPYIVYLPAAMAEKVFTWDSPVISSVYVGSDNIKTTHNGATFQGTYAPMEAGTMEDKWGVTSEAKIAKGTATASIKGFRAYFVLPDGVSGARLSFYDDATGITTIIGADELNDDKVYNLGGQRVQNPKKGLYIINGKKVVIK